MAAANSACIDMFTTFVPFFAQAIIVQRNATNIVAILLFCRYSQFYIQLAYRATIPFTVKSKNPFCSLFLNNSGDVGSSENLEGKYALNPSYIFFSFYVNQLLIAD